MHTEKLKPMIMAEIARNMLSNVISVVAFTFVLLGEKSSEEVDDYDNYYYYYYE